jgi:inositol monophosphatase 3
LHEQQQTTSSSSSSSLSTSSSSSTSYSHMKGFTDEGVGEPVTQADIASNEIFIKGLRHRFPGLSIFTEEEINNNELQQDIELQHQLEEGKLTQDEFELMRKKYKEEEDQFYNSLLQPISSPNIEQELQSDPVFPLSDLLVTIDPLDATKEFTENLLNYVTTQQCVLYKGHPILGVIHQPFESTNPTTALPTLKQVIGGSPHDKASQDGSDVVIISKSHSGEADHIVKDLFTGKKILKAGGAGYKALAVYSNIAEVYFHATKTKIWDVCAPAALFQASGGDSSDTFGNDLVFNPMNPVLLHGFLGSTSTEKHEWYLDHIKHHEVDLRSKIDGSASMSSSSKVPKGATLLKGRPS